jgi:TolB-like protein/Flp pilus assembly protein TadD
LPLDFAGEQPVKNIARPVRTYAVRFEGTGQPWRLRLRQYAGRLRLAAAAIVVLALIGGGVWWIRPVGPADAKPSIAVLPFDNFGGDEATGRLADGITEDIITDLARYHDLEVIARNSVKVYKDKAVDIRQVGKDLNVRYVLEGSIQHQADRVRVTAQLIDAASGTHVWSNSWDRPAADVFAVQSELADQVAANLGGYSGTIIENDRDAAKRKRPSDLNAYDLYLLGVEAKHRQTQESVTQAIDFLKRSLAIDPTFARAWTALAWAYDLSGSWAADWNVTHKLDLDAAHRAVDLDPQDAEGRAALGFALAEEGNMVQSEAEFDKALSLNPNSAEILTWYSAWAIAFGKADAGARAADTAMRLNPNPPQWALGMLGYAFFAVGRYEDALSLYQQKPKESFDKWDYVTGAAILAALGRQDEAKVAVAAALAHLPTLTIESWISDPVLSPPERERFADLMHKAGFPACASADDRKQNSNLVRLPECAQPRATN